MSTSLAVLQFAKWRRDRPRLTVTAKLVHSPASDTEDPNSGIGTPVMVERGRDVLNERVAIAITIANHGEQALQIVGVIVEGGAGDITNANQIVPSPLPAVIEPRSMVTVTVQKEFLDMESEVFFFGVVDALGRRHPVAATEAQTLIERAWEMPTRVAWFRRRDDPQAEPVRAFQARQPSSITSRPKAKSDRSLASRPVPKPSSSATDGGTES